MHTQGIESQAGHGGRAGDTQIPRSENSEAKPPAHHPPFLKARVSGPGRPGNRGFVPVAGQAAGPVKEANLPRPATPTVMEHG